MNDIEKAAKHIANAMIADKNLKLKTIKMPCPFGGGDCLISSPGMKGDGEDGVVYHIIACSKAVSAKDGIFGKSMRESQLREMGCPKPNYSAFSGWKCKYADGSWYPI